MTSDTFNSKSKRLKVVFHVAFFGVAVPLLAGVSYVAHWVSTEFAFRREIVFVVATPLACGALVVGGFTMQMLDRRFGIRCPRCGQSLTFRRHPERIVASGLCPDCQASVFNTA